MRNIAWETQITVDNIFGCTEERGSAKLRTTAPTITLLLNPDTVETRERARNEGNEKLSVLGCMQVSAHLRVIYSPFPFPRAAYFPVSLWQGCDIIPLENG